ncbi:MAG: hypothetical protein R3C54_07710 [Parvularculaceae bacterium]
MFRTRSNILETPALSDRAPPTLGQHTDEVLRDFLGLQGEEVSALKKAGVLGQS